MTTIKCYHIKHRLDLDNLINKAHKVANYAVDNKNNFKLLTSKYVKQYGLPSIISNQLLRKYGKGTIKKVSNVNLIVPNLVVKHKNKKGEVKLYPTIEYLNERVYIKPLKLNFRWNPGKTFEKINQIEISNDKFMISVTFKNQIINQEYKSILGIDLNCGVGRSIANCANLKNGEVLNLGKSGPNIRKYYYKKRKAHVVKNDKEKRKLKDLDHKISRKIVNYALKHKLKIVVEDLTGIRKKTQKGKGSKSVNRFVNSWSFYRLQSFIEWNTFRENKSSLHVSRMFILLNNRRQERRHIYL